MGRLPAGWANGLTGVVIFAGSLPATRAAVLDIEPVFLTAIRATIAGCLALVLLLVLRQPRPRGADWMSLMLVALGVVVGFPLCTALALQEVSSAHAILFVGLLPLCTAVFAVVRGGERPQRLFWVFSVLGSACVAAYAAMGGLSASLRGDMLMLLAIVVCGLGYAEGARLSRTLGGWQVICWALVVSLPLMMPLAWMEAPTSFANVGLPAWTGLVYVSLFSMLIGFVFWYRGLVQGGIATVGQLQLLQPFFGLLLAALVMHEQVSALMLLVMVATVACVAGAKKFAG